MYWLRDNVREDVPTVSLHVIGRVTDITMTLVVEAGETVQGAFLSTVMSAHASLLKAKYADLKDPWMVIGAGMDPACYLGTLAPGNHEIIFRLNFPATHRDGISIVPVQIVYGLGAPKPGPTFQAEYGRLWKDDYDAAAVWRGYHGEEDSDGRPYRTELRETGSGVDQFDVVYTDTDDSRLIKPAEAGASGKESCVIGMVTDAGEGYTFRDYSAAILDPISGKIYEHGGQIGGVAVKSVGVFDTDNQCWLANAADSSVERYFHAVVYRDGKIYIWAGKGISGLCINSLECLDLTTGLWTTLTAGGTARYGHYGFEMDGKLYFVGGLSDTDTEVLTVDIFDPAATDTEEIWTVAPFTLSLGFAAPGEVEPFPYLPALAFDPETGYLYTHGGYDSENEELSRTVKVWDMVTSEQISAVFSGSDERWAGRGVIATIGDRKAFVICGGRCNSSIATILGSTVNDANILLCWLDTGAIVFSGLIHEKRVLANAIAVDNSLFYWGGRDTEPQENMEIIDLQTRERNVLPFTENRRKVVKAGTVKNRAWNLIIGQQLWLSSTPGGFTTERPEIDPVQIGTVTATDEICIRPIVRG